MLHLVLIKQLHELERMGVGRAPNELHYKKITVRTIIKIATESSLPFLAITIGRILMH